MNACPTNAIQYVEALQTDGSIAAEINKEKCINCDVCRDVYPVIKPCLNQNFDKPDCYAGMASDQIREKISSGGAFTLIAQSVLRRGGLVCGAAWAKDFSVHHILISRA